MFLFVGSIVLCGCCFSRRGAVREFLALDSSYGSFSGFGIG